MRIQVRDDKGRPLGAIIIKVEDLDAKEAAKQNLSGWHRLADRLLLKLVRSRQTAPTETRNKKQKAGRQTKTKTVEIKITLPSFPRWPGAKQFAANIKGASRRSLVIGLVCLIAILASTSVVLSGSKDHPAAAADASPSNKTPQLTRGTPKYATVLPAGKTIQQLGGWARVSPPNRDPVYAYADRIGTTRIDVSEQPLPAKFIGDTDNQVAQLAKNFNANEKFAVKGSTIFVAKQSDGSQSLIFSRSNLLIFITSGFTLSNNQWAAYVASLK